MLYRALSAAEQPCQGALAAELTDDPLGWVGFRVFHFLDRNEIFVNLQPGFVMDSSRQPLAGHAAMRLNGGNCIDAVNTHEALAVGFVGEP